MLQSESQTPPATRRNFLKWSIFGLLFAFFGGVLNVVTRYLLPPPKVHKVQELIIPVTQVPIGTGMNLEYKGAPVILIHTEQGFSAFNATCTHLGCLVKWVSRENLFYCPCHAAKFDPAGKVISGPAPEPLHKVEMKIQNNDIVFL